MKLIFIYGMPATGKLTVARELEKISGFKLFHNHQVVDLLLSMFEFGSREFVELREVIWLSVFEQACRSGMKGLIFTFAPETTVRATFVGAAIRTIEDAGGELEFVELTCPFDELLRRVGSPSRQGFQKLTSTGLFEQLHSGGVFDSSHMPKAKVSIDTSTTTPEGAARAIAEALGLGRQIAIEKGESRHDGSADAGRRIDRANLPLI